MNLRRVDRGAGRKGRKSGFALLEAVIALLIIAMAISVGYLASIQSLKRQNRVELDLQLLQFAQAIVSEYTVTRSDALLTGSYRETWSWQIETNTQSHPILDGESYQEVSVAVWAVGRDHQKVTVISALPVGD
ncbi:type II secretion system protein [Ruegeria sp. HKCCD8929]|uniref:type II secretion system protein n=1 Tax=Ruegeria sp. HKCCD8929 TaxID=2683006 RepID=UPI0014894978|nr:type II secretion system protein [Ruegeria sp. HKCCD8929]